MSFVNKLISKQESGFREREQLDEERQRDAKRRKTENVFPSAAALNQILLESIWNAYQAAKGESGSVGVIEVEARIGMLKPNEKRRWTDVQTSTDASCILITDTIRDHYHLQFEPGIDEHLIGHMSKVLGPGEVKPVQRVRLNAKGMRWEVSANTNSNAGVKVLESKKRVVLHDLALRSHHYDLRLDVNVETPVIPGSGGEPAVNTDQYVCEREKRRTSFLPGASVCPAFAKAPCCWKVDLTHVKSTACGAGAGESTHNLELEFELLEGASKHWLSLSHLPPQGAPPGTLAPAAQFARQLSWQLLQVLNACVPCELEQRQCNEEMLTTINRDHPARGAIEHDIRRLNALMYGKQRGVTAELDFPGSMPVNLVRRNMVLVETLDYFVTEKSDGVRYLLYVVNTAAPGESPKVQAVVMDRAREISLVLGAGALGEALGAGTVLDGELIFHQQEKLGRQVYLIFDVLALDGERLVDRPFSERLALINGTIIPRINAALGSGSAAGVAGKTLLMFPKQFFPKRDITQLVNRFQTGVGGEHMYVVNPAAAPIGATAPRSNAVAFGMRHKSDGIVFQPDTPYQFRTDTQLLKWKWMELASVDLLVSFEDDTVRLFAGGSDGQLIECTQRSRVTGLSNVPRFDSYRLWADVKECIAARPLTAASKPCIVEVGYSSAAGGWRYHCIRADKTIPNHINTVMNVFMELADDISIEELEYTLLARTREEKDYIAQINKMKTALLAHQRNRTGARK